jgi:hypothetical protein
LSEARRRARTPQARGHAAAGAHVLLNMTREDMKEEAAHSHTPQQTQQQQQQQQQVCHSQSVYIVIYAWADRCIYVSFHSCSHIYLYIYAHIYDTHTLRPLRIPAAAAAAESQDPAAAEYKDLTRMPPQPPPPTSPPTSCQRR